MNAHGHLAVALALLVLALAFLLVDGSQPLAPSNPTAPPGASRPATEASSAAASAEFATRATRKPTPRVERIEPPGFSQTSSDARWSVLVVDPARRPIAGARVELVEIRPAREVKNSRRRVQLRDGRRTGKDGIARFVPPQNGERFGIVVAAEGWLRSALAPPVALVNAPSAPLVIALRPGRKLRGRVVDERARPVPNLALLALSAGYRVDHVSMSSVALRAQDRFRDPRNANYHQSRTTTAADGSVTFGEVPPKAKMVIRSDDPAWHIVGREITPGESPTVTWTVAPSFGVVVRVLDNYRRPVLAAATFRVDLELADGSSRQDGQWVGKGLGQVRFSCDGGPRSEIARLDVVRAVFHGTVTTSAGTRTWRARPILNPVRGGVAELEILVAAQARDADRPLDSTPRLPLALDVLGSDGQPFVGPLQVAWSCDTRAGNPTDEVRAVMVRPGVYRATVPVPGDVRTIDLLVQPDNASGSVKPWTKTVPAIPDQQQTLSVRLPLAGSVTIVRPTRWTAAWRVRASFRERRGDPWQEFGSFDADDDRLALACLLPAEWRFELAQEESVRTTTLEVLVEAGDEQVIGG